MSIRSEIRAGLSEDGKPLYQLDPKVWPEKPDSAEATVRNIGVKAI